MDYIEGPKNCQFGSAIMNRIVIWIKASMALVPFIFVMFALYRLEVAGILMTETPHRGKISVFLLTVGMALSFFAYTLLFERRKED